MLQLPMTIPPKSVRTAIFNNENDIKAPCYAREKRVFAAFRKRHGKKDKERRQYVNIFHHLSLTHLPDMTVSLPTQNKISAIFATRRHEDTEKRFIFASLSEECQQNRPATDTRTKRHTMRKTYLIALAILLHISGIPMHGQTFRVATWNLENAFDTAHDKGKDDLEFTPTSVRRWNSGRYWRKLKGIGQTLAAMQLPDLVALQEVENDTVLRDLTVRTPLRKAGYRYVMTDGPDRRGVDVALLYRKSSFTLLSWQSLHVDTEKHGLRPTRDILMAHGVTGKDTLYVMVLHLPSRRNNNRDTRLTRNMAVDVICHTMDSLKGKKVIVMGDFNAEPGDMIFERLGHQLCTLLPTEKKTLRGPRGTYCFRGIWGFLDHILVSPPLLSSACGKAEECRFPWLLRGKKQIPHRTYGGTSYLGGLSDHLPLTVSFSTEGE